MIHPVLQHEADFLEEGSTHEPTVPVHRPEDEALEPDQERQGEALLTMGELAQGNQDSDHYAYGRQEQLEVLGQGGADHQQGGGGTGHRTFSLIGKTSVRRDAKDTDLVSSASGSPSRPPTSKARFPPASRSWILLRYCVRRMI